jgi:hypothetical protein
MIVEWYHIYVYNFTCMHVDIYVYMYVTISVYIQKFILSVYLFAYICIYIYRVYIYLCFEYNKIFMQLYRVLWKSRFVHYQKIYVKISYLISTGSKRMW